MQLLESHGRQWRLGRGLRRVALLGVCVGLLACGDDGDGGKGSNGETPCGVAQISGQPSVCHQSVDCEGVAYDMDCDAAQGECTCSEDDVVVATIGYDPSLCPTGSESTQADYNALHAAARSACGWP